MSGRSWRFLRIVLCGVLLLACLDRPLRQANSAPPLVRGLTLVLSPAALPFLQRTVLTVRVLDSQGHPLAGVRVQISGISVSGQSTLVTSSQPLQFLANASGAGVAQVRVSRAGYAAVTAQLRILPPAAPAYVAALQQAMTLRSPGDDRYRRALLHQDLFFRWRAHTGSNQLGALRFADGSTMALDRDTEVTLNGPARSYLNAGQVLLQIATGGQAHDVETGSAVAATLGTRYLVGVKHGLTTVTVVSGLAIVKSHGHTVEVRPGQQTTSAPNSAPSPPHAVDTAKIAAWATTLAPLPIARGFATGYVLLPRAQSLAAITFATEIRQLLVLGREADDLVLSPAGTNLYVAGPAGIITVPTNGAHPHQALADVSGTAIAQADDGRNLLVGTADGKVLLVDPLRHTILWQRTLGYVATTIADAPGGLGAVIAGSGHLTILDPKSGTIRADRTFHSDVGTITFSQDGSLAYLPLSDAGVVLIFSLPALAPAGTIGLTPGARPIAAVLGAMGLLYIADAQTNAIDVVDPVAAVIRKRLPLRGTPLSMARGPDGKLVVATSVPELTIIDPQDGSALQHFALQEEPSRLVIYLPGDLGPAPGTAPGMDTSASSTTVASSVSQTRVSARDSSTTNLDIMPEAGVTNALATPTPETTQQLDTPTPEANPGKVTGIASVTPVVAQSGDQATPTTTPIPDGGTDSPTPQPAPVSDTPTPATSDATGTPDPSVAPATETPSPVDTAVSASVTPTSSNPTETPTMAITQPTETPAPNVVPPSDSPTPQPIQDTPTPDFAMASPTQPEPIASSTAVPATETDTPQPTTAADSPTPEPSSVPPQLTSTVPGPAPAIDRSARRTQPPALPRRAPRMLPAADRPR